MLVERARIEPESLTVQLLEEIRDELRRAAERTDARIEQIDRRIDRMDHHFERMGRRFEVVQTNLRDVSQQLMLLTRDIKTALDGP